MPEDISQRGDARVTGLGAAIELEDLVKRYGSTAAVDRVTLTIGAGEFVTLLGSSGSGKTTTLMMIAGFVPPDSGEIRIGGRDISGLPPERRGLGVVFQSYALFPHMTVFENVAFPLRLRRISSAEIARRVGEMLDLVDLGGLADRRIASLSGGQQQRVALARAIVFEPPVLLMDEPLGALDRKLRDQLQTEIKRIQQELDVTVVYVTHDQEEALALSDRIAIMSHGRIEQVGTPDEVYESPVSPFVASFLGESNFIEATRDPAAPDGGSFVPVAAPTLRLRGHPASSADNATHLTAMVRPEAIRLGETGKHSPNRVSGTVRMREFLGAAVRLVVCTPVGDLVVRLPRLAAGTSLSPGAEVTLSWEQEDMSIFPANSGYTSNLPGR